MLVLVLDRREHGYEHEARARPETALLCYRYAVQLLAIRVAWPAVNWYMQES